MTVCHIQSIGPTSDVASRSMGVCPHTLIGPDLWFGLSVYVGYAHRPISDVASGVYGLYATYSP